ncbi:MAG: transketolase C-terminal domain-containing protein [Jatrophihabitantaceae bacterium]
MRRLLEGSQAIARTVARCRPGVVPAYPITPQTHIVEALGKLIASGELANSVYLTVESEFAAMSAAIGASAAGSRSYTATASQGLLYMTEAVFNAAGLGLPIVMTVANRAIGAPINIWNDQSDSMSQRDCGWIQLYANDNQSALDLHVVAFALAERLSVPVMVCVDGFVLTHAFEPLEVPEADLVDSWLPPFRPRQSLDPTEPITIGAMVGPAAFTEVRYLAHRQLQRALPEFSRLAGEYGQLTGRPLAALETYRTAGADLVVVALGSVTGTLRALSDQLAEQGRPFGVLSLNMFRPFPYQLIRDALAGAKHVLVLERAFAPGADGVVSVDIRQALANGGQQLSTVVAGLGGRPVLTSSLDRMLAEAAAGTLAPFSFLDLDIELATGTRA